MYSCQYYSKLIKTQGNRDFQSRWRCRETHSASEQPELLTDIKTSNMQNHQKIELYRSPVNQGFKEDTFIQMSRKGGVEEMGRERCGTER